VNPFWHEDNRQRATLDFQNTDSDADDIMPRIDGNWTALGTGTNDDVNVLAYDSERGRVYVGGNFTTADGVTVNGICYWDGTTFVAMGTGVGIAGKTMNALKIAPNGDVWIGGNWTTAGGAASDGLAKWDVSASAWVQFTNGTPGDLIAAIEIDSTGRIYIGGTFTNWDGVGNADNIAQSTDGGATWTALSTGANGLVAAFEIDTSDNLYAGGAFTTIGGVSASRLAKWDGAAFTILGTGVDSTVFVLAFDLSGNLYIGGVFTDKGNRIVIWNGTGFETLGVGVNNGVLDIDISTSGLVLVGGGFSTAGGLDLQNNGLAGWNGTAWFHLDVDPPGSTATNAVLSLPNGDFYIGYNTTGTATLSGITTVTNGGTATVSPIITIFGPTTADTIAVLRWLENQTTGQIIFFDMSINTEEIITIDTRPGQVRITSNFRGPILDNPLDPGGLSLFNLLPGENVIAAFITDTITGIEMFIDSDLVHHGIEGVAV